jgi:signal transduction histidine kinase
MASLESLSRMPPNLLVRALDVRQEADPNLLTEVTLFGYDGSVIKGTLSRIPAGLPVDGDVHPLENTSPEGHDDAALAAAIRLADGRTLVVVRNIEVLVELRHVVMRALVFGVIPLVLLGLAGGAALSMQTARRLRIMHKAIARIMRGDLSERLPSSGSGDDLDRLTHEMNHMLDEIERLVGETKSVGDNIAHDLRTPLTRMRVRLERGRRYVHTREEICALIDAATADLDFTFGTITALLRIGEIESGRRRAGFGDIDVAEIAQEVGEIYAPIAEARGLHLDVRTLPVAHVFGDHDLIVEALANLVDNAIKFSPPSGTITIAVDPAPTGPALHVIDTGPGIPLAEREHVLRRFCRGDNARQVPGHGLGLNLVAAIARLHDFQLVIEDGPGCVINLICNARSRLPVPPANQHVDRHRQVNGLAGRAGSRNWVG